MADLTSDDVFFAMDGYVASAAVGAAMEHGVFWLLADTAMEVSGLADRLGVPEDRCRAWLELLVRTGYLEQTPSGYRTSVAARSAIVDAYSRETWAFLAREARERFPAVRDLAVDLGAERTPWEHQGIDPPDYLTTLRNDPERAREFTRMLYEIHLPLADTLARALEGEPMARLLDVGGGSGVMSFSLLRKHQEATSVVLDLSNVCAAGREIAEGIGMADRVEYREGDFLHGPLPTGFDLLLFCDVGPYDEALFGRFGQALAPGGRLAVVGKFGPEPGRPHPSRAHWALLGALTGPAAPHPTADDVAAILTSAGYAEVTAAGLAPAGSRWDSGWTLLTARRT